MHPDVLLKQYVGFLCQFSRQITSIKRLFKFDHGKTGVLL